MLEGYSSTLFAYGQTGSGKTYTMEGPARGGTTTTTTTTSSTTTRMSTATSTDAPVGLIPCAVHDLFEGVINLRKSGQAVRVTCSHVQIYMEQCYDLLAEEGATDLWLDADTGTALARDRDRDLPARLRPGLRLRWTQQQGFFLENLSEYECENAFEATRWFEHGIQHRAVASHLMNRASSRSHCLFTLTVEV